MRGNTGNQGKSTSKPLLYTWKDIVCSKAGPDKMTRLVLMVLSLYMDRDGGSCFPSTSTVAERAGMSKRAAGEHLRKAAKQGWILRSSRARSGQAWRRWSYQAAIPSRLREARESPRSEDVAKSTHVRGDYRRQKVGTRVPPNYPNNNSENYDWMDMGRLLRIEQRLGEPRSKYIERVRKANDERIANL